MRITTTQSPIPKTRVPDAILKHKPLHFRALYSHVFFRANISVLTLLNEDYHSGGTPYAYAT